MLSVSKENLKNNCLSEFSDNIVEYVSGYVVRRIYDTLSCDICKTSLTGKQRMGSLIMTREYDSCDQKLVYPCEFVNRSLSLSESLLRSELKKKLFAQKVFFLIMSTSKYAMHLYLCTL